MTKQWVTLLIGFGMPLVLILAVVLSMNYSDMRVKPAYDVLYATGSGYRSSSFFSVKGNTLVSDIVDDNGEMIQKTPSSNNDYTYQNKKEMVRTTNFYRYDPATDSSTALGGYADAHKLDIISIDRSPDGYRVTRSNGGGGGDFFFPFFLSGGSSYNGFVIEGNGGHKKVKLVGGENYYSTDIIGWVAK